MTKSLIYMTIPGTLEDPKSNSLLLRLQEDLEKRDIKSEFVDTIPGWGNLNQDWLQFRCEINTSYDWCEIVALKGEKRWPIDDEDIVQDLHELLNAGKLLMMVYYVEKDELVPHH